MTVALSAIFESIPLARCIRRGTMQSGRPLIGGRTETAVCFRYFYAAAAAAPLRTPEAHSHCARREYVVMLYSIIADSKTAIYVQCRRGDWFLCRVLWGSNITLEQMHA